MAIQNADIYIRLAAIEQRVNDLQKIIEGIPKLRQVGALKAVFEQELKDLNATVVGLTARIEKLENK
jgi:protein tyrosine/serine phosphatase